MPGLTSEYIPTAAWRMGHCYLGTDQGSEGFGPECAAPASPRNLPQVLLWGDSYAASLYPGLQKLEKKGRLRLAEYTASGCPPVLGVPADQWPHCPGVNGFVMGRITKARPDLVVLIGNWQNYPRLMGGSALDRGLGEALAGLKAAGVARILVFGQLPSFEVFMADNIVLLFKPGLCDRTSRGLVPGLADADAAVERIALSHGAEFFAPSSLLCNGEGCLLSLDPDRLVPVTLDTGHLTVEGSDFVVSHSPLGAL